MRCAIGGVLACIPGLLIGMAASAAPLADANSSIGWSNTHHAHKAPGENWRGGRGSAQPVLLRRGDCAPQREELADRVWQQLSAGPAGIEGRHLHRMVQLGHPGMAFSGVRRVLGAGKSPASGRRPQPLRRPPGSGFKAYIKEPGKVEGERTGDIAGIHARNEQTPTRDRDPASLHFTTAGESIRGNVRENIERMVIKSNGYVAIGDEFNKPTERVHVQGNIRAEGDIVASGAKKFVIPHPTQPGLKLVHSAIEGPEAAVYDRGEGQLSDGRAEVCLPEYFEALTAMTGRTVMLTNVDGFDQLAFQRHDGVQVKTGRVIVICNKPTSWQALPWEVNAIRADIPRLEPAKNRAAE